jgi:TetR/AcrR family transcriptional regulator, transcriptional repressor for nem operon
MSTKQDILTISKDLIQEFGSNGFSYQDIADKLKIKKASIHYYFPKKNDLLLELIHYYSDCLRIFLSDLDSDKDQSFKSKFAKYLQMYEELSSNGKQVCLCGILAGEIMTLPKSFRKEVAKFFDIHEQWLKALIEKAQENGEVSSNKNSSLWANEILSALQGGLIISRVNSDKLYMSDLLSSLKNIA